MAKFDTDKYECLSASGSILCLLMLICINDLFTDDTPLFFSVKHDIHISGNILNKHLEKINKWATHWKMNSYPEIFPKILGKYASQINFKII